MMAILNRHPISDAEVHQSAVGAEPPRFLIVVYEDYARDSRVRRHARALARDGAVEVLAVGRDEARAAGTEDGVLVTPLVASKYRGRHLIAYLLAYAGFIGRASLAIARRVARSRLRAVWVNNPPDVLVFAAFPAKLRGIPVVLDIHDMTSQLYEAKFLHAPRLLGWAVRFGELISYRFADCLLTIHDGYRQLLVQRVAKPALAVLNVPDEESWLVDGDRRAIETPCADRPVVLGHHGTIAERFGADLAVKAVALLRAEGVDVRLRIMGDGDFAPALERLIRQVDHDGAITFDRRVFRSEEVRDFAAQIDIGVAPYRPSRFIQQALPVKVLEYLILGVPVITAPTEVLMRYVGPDAVRLLPEPTVRALADAIRDLLAPEARQALSVASRAVARTLSWPPQRDRLMEWLNHVAPDR